MIVLVTGATSGFGAAIARRFAGDGHRIVAAGRRRDRLEALRDELGAERVVCVPLDVRDRAAVALSSRSCRPNSPPSICWSTTRASPWGSTRPTAPRWTTGR